MLAISLERAGLLIQNQITIDNSSLSALDDVLKEMMISQLINSTIVSCEQKKKKKGKMKNKKQKKSTYI